MIKKKLLKYTVIYSSEPEGGFTVTVPSLPGCVTYGKNLEEAEKMAKDAIRLYLESLKAHQESIPSDARSFKAAATKFSTIQKLNTEQQYPII